MTRRRWIVVAGLAMLLCGPGLVQYLRVAWHERRLARQLERWRTQQHALLDAHERLTTDPVYLEGLVRSTFKVAKPGEVVVPLDSSDASSSR